jgi:hypothetical protein
MRDNRRGRRGKPTGVKRRSWLRIRGEDERGEGKNGLRNIRGRERSGGVRGKEVQKRW